VKKVVAYTALMTLAIAMITMPVTVPLFKSSADYSIFNTGPMGLSKFARLGMDSGDNVVPILAPLNEFNISSKTGVLFIIGPNLTFTKEEMDQIRGFLEKGNTLVLADDFGTGNEILAGLHLPVRISRYPLNDFFYANDDRLIWVTRIRNPVLARGVKAILTNEPSAIIVTPRGDVYTSRVAMINLHMRMFPIIAEVHYGDGKIIIVSDPDIFANMQFNTNERFLKNLLSYLGGTTLYFDEVHHPDFNLYSAGTMTVMNMISEKTARAMISVLAFFLLMVELGTFSKISSLTVAMLARFIKMEKNLLAVVRDMGIPENDFMEILNKMGD
jgi:hypothetical protein